MLGDHVAGRTQTLNATYGNYTVTMNLRAAGDAAPKRRTERERERKRATGEARTALFELIRRGRG